MTGRDAMHASVSRRPVRTPRDARDEDAANEIIGFILMFAVSSIILVFSTQTYLASQENTDHLLRGVELKSVAARVATQVTHAGLVADEFPNATYTALMRVPVKVAGQNYDVSVDADSVDAAAVESDASASSTTYNLGTVQYVTVSGTAPGHGEWLNLTYSYTWRATSAGPVRDDPGAVYNYKNITLTKE